MLSEYDSCQVILMPGLMILQLSSPAAFSVAPPDG